MSEASVREQGTVKWFNEQKGYGFITGGDGEDIFVHYTAIQSKGYRTLKQDSTVEFTKVKTAKGLQAQSVEIVRS